MGFSTTYSNPDHRKWVDVVFPNRYGSTEHDGYRIPVKRDAKCVYYFPDKKIYERENSHHEEYIHRVNLMDGNKREFDRACKDVPGFSDDILLVSSEFDVVHVVITSPMYIVPEFVCYDDNGSTKPIAVTHYYDMSCTLNEIMKLKQMGYNIDDDITKTSIETVTILSRILRINKMPGEINNKIIEMARIRNFGMEILNAPFNNDNFNISNRFVPLKKIRCQPQERLCVYYKSYTPDFENPAIINLSIPSQVKTLEYTSDPIFNRNVAVFIENGEDDVEIKYMLGGLETSTQGYKTNFVIYRNSLFNYEHNDLIEAHGFMEYILQEDVNVVFEGTVVFDGISIHGYAYNNNYNGTVTFRNLNMHVCNGGDEHRNNLEVYHVKNINFNNCYVTAFLSRFDNPTQKISLSSSNSITMNKVDFMLEPFVSEHALPDITNLSITSDDIKIYDSFNGDLDSDIEIHDMDIEATSNLAIRGCFNSVKFDNMSLTIYAFPLMDKSDIETHIQKITDATVNQNCIINSFNDESDDNNLPLSVNIPSSVNTVFNSFRRNRKSLENTYKKGRFSFQTNTSRFYVDEYIYTLLMKYAKHQLNVQNDNDSDYDYDNIQQAQEYNRNGYSSDSSVDLLDSDEDDNGPKRKRNRTTAKFIKLCI